MEQIFTTLLNSISQGGPAGIFSILTLVIAGLVYDRYLIIKSMQEKSDHYRALLETVMDKYSNGQMSVVEALTEIKIILAKIEVHVS